MQVYIRVLVSLVCTLHTCTVLSRAEQQGHDIRRGDGRVGWRTIGGDAVWHGRVAVGVLGSLLLSDTAAHAMFQAGHAAAVFMATMAWHGSMQDGHYSRWAANGWIMEEHDIQLYDSRISYPPCRPSCLQMKLATIIDIAMGSMDDTMEWTGIPTATRYSMDMHAHPHRDSLPRHKQPARITRQVLHARQSPICCPDMEAKYFIPISELMLQ
jgi:hypothetical protein